MDIWERIRRWLRGDKSNPSIVTSRQAESRPSTSPSRLPKADETVIPVPTVPVRKENNFLLAFNKQDRHITTMFNSISLSSDMKTLYLIDNGRAIAYDLTNPKGVVIGLLGKQLVAATATGLEDAIDDTGVGETRRTNDGRSSQPEEETYKVTRNSQYTLTYNPGNEVMALIGAIDIIISIEAPDSTATVISKYNLKNQHVIVLKFSEEDGLTVSEKPRRLS